ncbi:hypothetical protein M0804_006321 [Polistes exclamans]|nr:hypothetical protein M0804_006321 [Polistes exclamans]
MTSVKWEEAWNHSRGMYNLLVCQERRIRIRRGKDFGEGCGVCDDVDGYGGVVEGVEVGEGGSTLRLHYESEKSRKLITASEGCRIGPQSVSALRKIDNVQEEEQEEEEEEA